MNKIVVILGYGIFEKSNHKYKDYLDKAIEVIQQAQELGMVIICGGFTAPQIELSEARSIKNYILELNPEISSKIILEEKSATTAQNLEFASKIIVESKVKPHMIDIICDSIRSPKIYYLALNYFSPFLEQSISEEEIYRSLYEQYSKYGMDFTTDQKLNCLNITIHGIGFDRNKQEIGDQIVNSMEEVVSLKYSSIAQDILIYKKR